MGREALDILLYSHRGSRTVYPCTHRSRSHSLYATSNCFISMYEDVVDQDVDPAGQY